ncbi:MAG: DegV family protein [Dorea sp.]|jgi:DegV family protein with EDD domain|nr:DegV family protein [Dorea sp.]
MNDTFYYEGIDLEQKTFFEHLANHDKIHTSQPSPADLMTIWENILKNGYDELVYIPMSSGLSGSYHTACQMAEDFSGKVYVADARRISVTQRHAVQDALYLVRQGMDAALIQKQLEKNAANSIVFVAVDDLDYLKRGGRITPAAAAMASILNIKPLLTIGEKKVDAYERVRGLKNCEKKLLKVMQERAIHFKSQGYDIRLGISGSFLNETDSSEWYARAKEVFPDDELLYDPLTCSISSHVGPNAFGMGISAKITL